MYKYYGCPKCVQNWLNNSRDVTCLGGGDQKYNLS